MDEHVDFTREPIIETVITPKDGCKLVVRSSKSNGQEEHFVDALEVVSFGHSFFFRSLERPKTFLVPATDYEVLEVREARMVLKNVGIDRSIKIGGGRDAQMRTPKEPQQEKNEVFVAEEKRAAIEEEPANLSSTEKSQEGRGDKKRERRRNYRRRRGRDGTEEGQEGEVAVEKGEESKPVMTTSILTSLLPPPPTLISETIARYKENFKDAFYTKEDKSTIASSQEEEVLVGDSTTSLDYGTFEVSDQEEGEIYQQRKQQSEQLENEEQDALQPRSDEEHGKDTPETEHPEEQF
jgi:hypothetical protein